MLSKKRPRPAVPKTKTFTGCWTCRARKVKCDGHRPACHRCQKGGHTCEGFDVKLYWVTDDDEVAPSAIRRQAMNILATVPVQNWVFDNNELDRLIAYVEERAESLSYGHGTLTSGPFSVFMSMRPSNATTDHDEFVDDHHKQFNAHGSAHYTFSNDIVTQNCYTSQQLDDNDGVLFISSPTPSWTSSSSSISSSSSELQLLPSLNPSMFRDSITDMLVNNYVFEVANVLTPVSHPKSHYAAVYIPKALDGAAAVMSGLDLMVTTSKVTPGNVAIFYTILATSAFYMHSSPNGKNLGLRFDVLAGGFRGKAIKYLRKALQNSIQENESGDIVHQSQSLIPQSEAIISAMMSLVTMDVVEGSMNEYRIHLSGIEKVAKQMRKSAPLSPQTKRLLTICSFLTTISDTTSPDLPALPWPEAGIATVLDLDEEISNPDFGLEFTYGITPTLVSLMRQVTSLSQRISYYTTRGASLPSSLHSTYLRLLASLSSWSFEEEPLASHFSGLEGDINFKIARHHILAFLNSIRIYYHTRVLGCDPQEMAKLVSRVNYHLTHIEAIKKEADYGTRIGTTLSWPGFIASCEAEQGPPRDAWYPWWQSMSSRPIGNISRLWQVVQEAWRIRDEEDIHEVPAWMPVLRRTGQRIIAV